MWVSFLISDSETDSLNLPVVHLFHLCFSGVSAHLYFFSCCISLSSFVFSWLNCLPSLPAVKRDPPIYGRSLTACISACLSAYVTCNIPLNLLLVHLLKILHQLKEHCLFKRSNKRCPNFQILESFWQR